MSKAFIQIGYESAPGVVVFFVTQKSGGARRSQTVEFEVACTGNLRADVANVAKRAFRQGRMVKRPEGVTAQACSAHALYSIDRTTAPVGRYSVNSPVWDLAQGEPSFDAQVNDLEMEAS